MNRILERWSAFPYDRLFRTFKKETRHLTYEQMMIFKQYAGEMDIIPLPFFLRRKIRQIIKSNKFRLFCQLYGIQELITADEWEKTPVQ
jgi:hypothetical protein